MDTSVKIFREYLKSRDLPLDFENLEKERLAMWLHKLLQYYVDSLSKYDVRRNAIQNWILKSVRTGLKKYWKNLGKAIKLVKCYALHELELLNLFVEQYIDWNGTFGKFGNFYLNFWNEVSINLLLLVKILKTFMIKLDGFLHMIHKDTDLAVSFKDIVRSGII